MQNLDNKSWNIQDAYNLYVEWKLVVNRRYQRKLVWDLSDKQRLIESILSDYPLPLFLFAQDGNWNYEIIDWMQRLNAIFSFLENNFSTKNGLNFDLDTLAMSKKLKDSRLLQQKEELLDRDSCVKFWNYPLSISIYKNGNERSIDEIFMRINSWWKRLSAQELRQAWVLWNYSDLVRNIAIYIRWDISSNTEVGLRNMNVISLSEEEWQWVYIPNIFWIKEKIISKDELKWSEDEYIISHILSYILLPKNEKIRVSNQTADNLYWRPNNEKDVNKSFELNKRLNDFIDIKWKDALKNQFLHIKEFIENFTKDCNTNFHTIFKKNSGNCIREFITFFLVLHRIIYVENKTGKSDLNYHNIFDKIEKTTLQFTEWWKWSIKNQEDNMSILYDRLIEFFEDNKNPNFDNSTYTELEWLLRYSVTENDFYDFKQWLCEISEVLKINDALIEKILKTITAIHNIAPEKNGYIYIGIADKKEDAEKIKTEQWSDYIVYSGKYIVGVNRESPVKGDIDKYYQFFISKIKDSTKLSDTLKAYISYENCRYQWKSIFVIKIRSWTDLEAFDSEFYVRKWANNCLLKWQALVATMKGYKR